MKLLLHIGTEKTGSSFLQSLLAQNRDKLANANIFFPKAGRWEKEMLAGRISPGNGEALHRALIQRDYTKVRKLLNGYIRDLKNNNCFNLLISNELLITAFSEADIVEKFQSICKENDLELTQMLLVIRDPVEHALSLYKHRAKSGTVGYLDEWLEKGYQLPFYLNRFLENVEKYRLPVTFRKYKKDPQYMVNLFFTDWLEIEKPKFDSKFIVNPSLTLSELLLIKK